MPRSWKPCTGFAASLVLLLAAAPAAAADRTIADNFFNAGAQAFDAGQYVVAAEAFMKGHEATKSPAFLFSAAQAYRRQYLIDASPKALRHAVQLFRQYLREDPFAKRRDDAIEALSDLAPLAARLPRRRASVAPQSAPITVDGKPMEPIPVPKGQAAEGAAPASGTDPVPAEAFDDEALPPEPPPKTRLLLTAKPDTAEISVDGAAFKPAPVVVEVKPGAHTVQMRAAGFHDETLSVQALKNELVPHHVALRPKGAHLKVTGTAGARVAVDGQLRAALPASLALDPGEYFIAVTKTGYEPYTEAIQLDRDQTKPLDVSLSMTAQRKAAWTILATGAGGVIATGVLTGLMIARQSEASSLYSQVGTGTLTAAQRDQYNRAVLARGDFARAAGITAGGTALTLATGLGLFVFDNIEVLPPSKDEQEAPGEPKPRVDFTVGLTSIRARIQF